MTVKKAEPFQFSMCGIKIWEEICFYKDSKIKAKVVEEKKVEYKWKKMTLTRLAMQLIKKDYYVQWPMFFTYKWEILAKLRKKLQQPK